MNEVGLVSHCVQEQLGTQMQDIVSAMLMGVRKAASSGNKKQLDVELLKLVGCKVDPEKGQPFYPEAPVMHQTVSEWVESDFSQDLVAMLATAPNDRPSPAKVLESKWLQHDYDEASSCLKSAACSNGVQPTCTFSFEQDVYAALLALATPIIMLSLSLSGCCCCTFCGACCSFTNGTPSAIWTGLALGACIAGGAYVANMWLGLGIFLVLPALLLAAGAVYLGTNSSRMRPAWIGVLATSTLWCLGISILSRVALSPLLRFVTNMVPFAGKLIEPFVGEVAPDKERLVSTWLNLSYYILLYTLMPSICGFFLAVFGLFRATVKHHEEQARSPHVEVQGVQLESFRQPPA